VLPLVILLCLLSLTVSTRSVLCIKIRHYQTLSSTVSCTGSGRVGLGQSADGLGWIGSHKMDPWTSLLETKPVSADQNYALRFGLGLEGLASVWRTNGLQVRNLVSISTWRPLFRSQLSRSQNVGSDLTLEGLFSVSISISGIWRRSRRFKVFNVSPRLTSPDTRCL